MRKVIKTISVWFLLVLLASAGIFIGKWGIENVGAANDAYEELKTFTEVLTIVEKNYVEEVKVKDLVAGAIRGMLSSLDPHSGYMTPDSYKEMQVDTKGEFGGLGIQIGMKENLLTVIAPIEDTPAFKAGIKAGDIILKVDGETTKDMTLFDAVKKMRGPKGTTVTINVIREGWKEPKDFAIVRDIIKIKSVKHKVMEEGIGYVKVNQFQENTADDLAASLKELKAQSISSLVLDLRNDPGGLLNSAIDVADQFLPPGRLVTYIKGRSGEKQEYLTRGQRPAYDFTMIVLVNQGSASASEIVAGALKDWDRAVILGVTTFGKGSVQSVIPLSEGSALRLTTAKYYTPKGVSIQNTGIKPDIEVKLPVKDGEGHVVIREKDLKGHLTNDQAGDVSDEKEKMPVKIDEEDDTQLKRAVELLQMWNKFKRFPENKQ
ncbi:MAG: S41 family peptidase [bacterium]